MPTIGTTAQQAATTAAAYAINPWYAVATIASNVLAAFTAPKPPKPQRTNQDIWYGRMIQRGAAMTRRNKEVQKIAAGLTGRPESDFVGSRLYQQQKNKLYDEALPFGYGAALTAKDPKTGKTASELAKKEDKSKKTIPATPYTGKPSTADIQNKKNTQGGI